MADKSGITWTSATWNPITGCAKVSAGCKHCYAERDWVRLTHLPAYAGRSFTDVACHPDRLSQPIRWQRPRQIFVNSMSDLFIDAIPDAFIDKVFAVMAHARQHTFQVLTKRPERMLKYLTTNNRSSYWAHAANELGLAPNRERRSRLPPGSVKGWPAERYDSGDFPGCAVGGANIADPLPNVWLGVSVEDQEAANARIPLLLQTPAAVRWISAEPLLGPVDLTRISFPTGVLENVLDCRVSEIAVRAGIEKLNGIDWVVVGGESGAKARPMRLDWARSLRDTCLSAGVPFFFKQTGLWQEIESIEDSRNIPADKLSYVRDMDATFARTKGGGVEVLDGREWRQWPMQKEIACQ